MKKILKYIIYKTANNFFDIPIEKYYTAQNQFNLFSIDEKRKYRIAALNNVLENGIQNTKFYPSLFGIDTKTFPEIKCEDDFSKLETITKKDVIAGKNQMLTGSKQLSIKSSGATGDASSISMSAKEAGAKFGIYLSVLKQCGFLKNDKIFQFYPKNYENKIIDKSGSLLQMFCTFLQNKIAHNLITNRELLFYNNSFVTKEEATRFVKRIEESFTNETERFVIIARADFLFSLIWFLKQYNIEMPTPIAVITCGTLLTETMAEKIKDFIQCPLYNLYGCSEVSFMALSKKNKETVSTLNIGQHIEIEPIEKLKNYHTNAGEIIVTDLINKTMPLIRYRTGDIGVKINFDTFKILGRKENIITLGDRVFTEYDLLEMFFTQDMPFFLLEHFEQSNYLHILKGISLDYSFKKHMWNLGFDNLEIYKKDTIEFKDKFNYIKTDALPEKPLNPKSQNTPCVICNNYNHKIIFDNNIQRIFQCLKCSFLTAVPLDDNLYIKQNMLDRMCLSINLESHITKSQNILKRIQKRYSNKRLQGLSILDIGCGNASLYSIATKHQMHYYGLEPDSAIYYFAQENFPDAKLENTDLENAENLPEQIDIIVLNHTLEHIKNPIRFLKRCFSILQPGGIIYIEVPSDKNAVTTLKFKKAFSIDTQTPTSLNHLSLFTNKSLKTAVLKTGFRKLKLKSISRFGNLANIKTALGSDDFTFKLKIIFGFFFITRLDVILQQGYITATAIKPKGFDN